jgi:SNF2 family DNA or RNA helicase
MLNLNNSTSLPLTYAEVKLNAPEGYSVSEIILDGAVEIRKTEQKYTSRIVGKIRKKGELEYIPVHTCGANYIVYKNIIHPLPRDIVTFYKKLLAGIDENNLTFPDILRISRSKLSLEVVIEPSIFDSAKQQAEGYTLVGPINGLDAQLYKYQENGVAWMMHCLQVSNGLILADEMGLGKTIQIIAVLLQLSISSDKPALIVCTTTLIANWQREISRFAPKFTYYVHRGSDRVATYKKLKSTDIVITTYETLVEDISLFRSFGWSIIVADEAQAIKNPSSIRRKAIVQVKKDYTIAVTGTPIENSIKDIWSLSDFAIPGILGTEQEFDAMYSDHDDSPRQLSKITSPFVLRRMVCDVANDLPERIDTDLPLELGEDLSKKYDFIRKDISEKYNKAAALVATGQLQLFCAHPWLQSKSFSDENWEDLVDLKIGPPSELYTPKINRTSELLCEAFNQSKKVLVFSIFNRVADLIKMSLMGSSSVDFFWGTVNGSTPQSDRQEIVDEFSNHQGPGVLVLNPKAAGSGLNITAATIVIHYTQVWNPAIEAQASARAHRRGQNSPVSIYRLYYEKTVEEIMLSRTLWKRSLANDAIPITTRNKNDFEEALKISPLS